MEKQKTFLFSRDQTNDARDILSCHRKNTDLGAYRDKLIDLVRQASLKKQLILDGPIDEEDNEPKLYQAIVDPTTGETTTSEVDQEKAQAFLASFFSGGDYKKPNKAQQSLSEIDQYLSLKKLETEEEQPELSLLDSIVDDLATELFLTDAEIAATEASIYQKVQEFHKKHHAYLYD